MLPELGDFLLTYIGYFIELTPDFLNSFCGIGNYNRIGFYRCIANFVIGGIDFIFFLYLVHAFGNYGIRPLEIYTDDKKMISLKVYFRLCGMVAE